MAIITEQTYKTEGSKGIDKIIDPNSASILMRQTQLAQYKFPIKSMVREIITNAKDAIKEKSIALQILLSNADISEYFIKEDAFIEEYYSPEHLELTNDTVKVTYTETGNSFDYFTVEDTGVGIGHVVPKDSEEQFLSRLEGYFAISYSSKRNTNTQVGAFGLGAKAALSTRIPYFEMETVHNGKLFRFHIYVDKIDSVIPKWNQETERKNNSLTLYERYNSGEQKYEVFYEDTDRKNGTIIKCSIRSWNKNDFIEAVKTQFFMDNSIEMSVVNKLGCATSINIYQDPKILNEFFGIWSEDVKSVKEPYLIIGNIPYSRIEWDELELEDRKGRIGVIMQPEEVTISPSREDVIWDNKTIKAVRKRIEEIDEQITSILPDLNGKSPEETIEFVKRLQTDNFTQEMVDFTRYNLYTGFASNSINYLLLQDFLDRKFNKNTRYYYVGYVYSGRTFIKKSNSTTAKKLEEKIKNEYPDIFFSFLPYAENIHGYGEEYRIYEGQSLPVDEEDLKHYREFQNYIEYLKTIQDISEIPLKKAERKPREVKNCSILNINAERFYSKSAGFSPNEIQTFTKGSNGIWSVNTVIYGYIDDRNILLDLGKFLKTCSQNILIIIVSKKADVKSIFCNFHSIKEIIHVSEFLNGKEEGIINCHPILKNILSLEKVIPKDFSHYSYSKASILEKGLSDAIGFRNIYWNDKDIYNILPENIHNKYGIKYYLETYSECSYVCRFILAVQSKITFKFDTFNNSYLETIAEDYQNQELVEEYQELVEECLKRKICIEIGSIYNYTTSLKREILTTMLKGLGIEEFTREQTKLLTKNN